MTMQTSVRASAAETTGPEHHQVILPLFGLSVRAHGGALPVATTVSLMQDIGMEPTVTRSSNSRLKNA